MTTGLNASLNIRLRYYLCFLIIYQVHLCAMKKFFLFFTFSVVIKPPYEVTETGWGEFEIIIKIYFVDPNERPVSWLF